MAFEEVFPPRGGRRETAPILCALRKTGSRKTLEFSVRLSPEVIEKAGFQPRSRVRLLFGKPGTPDIGKVRIEAAEGGPYRLCKPHPSSGSLILRTRVIHASLLPAEIEPVAGRVIAADAGTLLLALPEQMVSGLSAQHDARRSKAA